MYSEKEDEKSGITQDIDVKVKFITSLNTLNKITNPAQTILGKNLI